MELYSSLVLKHVYAVLSGSLQLLPQDSIKAEEDLKILVSNPLIF